MQIPCTIPPLSLLLLAALPLGGMRVGVNFAYMAPGWSGERPFVGNLPPNPWTSGFNIWSETFLADNENYQVFRMKDWSTVNPVRETTTTEPNVNWSDRRLPDDPGNFADNSIGTGEGPGFAYEWQIDLCNRMGVDYWCNLPVRANDDYIRQLARLTKQQLDPGATCYVELANEIWNFAREQNYAIAQGIALGLQRPDNPSDDWGTGMRWQAYRSAQMWAIWEEEWADDTERLVNVLSGWSTNTFLTQSLHLAPLFQEAGFNPTGALPEAYAIAPYFGGNGLPGADPNVWELLRTDLFEHRWNNPGVPSRMQNVRDQYAIVTEQYKLPLVCYEGGQHLAVDAVGPNRHPEMYNLYQEYLDALKPYVQLFLHWDSCGACGNGGCFGALEYTGQDPQEAHKYRALMDWMEANPDDGGGQGEDQAPLAVLAADPTSGSAPLAVSLDASASTDPEGATLTFAWDLGDGRGFVAGGPTQAMVCENEGTYTVWVRVSDGARSSLDSASIQVSPSGVLQVYYRLDITQGATGAWGNIREINWLVGEISYPDPPLTGFSELVTSTGINGWNAFDGSTTAGWELQSPVGTITIALVTPAAVDSVRIRVTENRRAPGAFTVATSTDATHWTEVGSCSGLIDTDWADLDRTFALAVPDTTPRITTASLPDGTVGSPYAAAFSAVDGNGPRTWSIPAGELPLGLTLAANGLVSGIPTSAGTARFTVQVADEEGDRDSREMSVVVRMAPLWGPPSNEPKWTEHGWIWDAPYPFIYAYGAGAFAWVYPGSEPASIFLYVFNNPGQWCWTGTGYGLWHYVFDGINSGWATWQP